MWLLTDGDSQLSNPVISKWDNFRFAFILFVSAWWTYGHSGPPMCTPLLTPTPKFCFLIANEQTVMEFKLVLNELHAYFFDTKTLNLSLFFYSLEQWCPTNKAIRAKTSNIVVDDKHTKQWKVYKELITVRSIILFYS